MGNLKINSNNTAKLEYPTISEMSTNKVKIFCVCVFKISIYYNAHILLF